MPTEDYNLEREDGSTVNPNEHSLKILGWLKLGNHTLLGVQICAAQHGHEGGFQCEVSAIVPRFEEPDEDLPPGEYIKLAAKRADQVTELLGLWGTPAWRNTLLILGKAAQSLAENTPVESDKMLWELAQHEGGGNVTKENLAELREAYKGVTEHMSDHIRIEANQDLEGEELLKNVDFDAEYPAD